MNGITKVLSIDGGGIRGIIPAIFLDEIEKRTNKRISDLFDLIVGTSTGGILALGLANLSDEVVRPEIAEPEGSLYTAASLVTFYRKDGSRIFPAPQHSAYLRKLLEAFRPKYCADGIESILKARFGDVRLSDAKTKVLITSYDIEKRVACLFANWVPAKNGDVKGVESSETEYMEGDYLMWKVARATSAAPTYFEPALVGNLKSYSRALIDGGVFANNPGLHAYSHALKYIRESKELSEQKLVLISLGTGVLSRQFEYCDVRKWGQVSWAKPIIDITFFSMCNTVDMGLERLLGDSNREEGTTPPCRFYRLQLKLDSFNEDLDNAEPDNITSLENKARQYIECKETLFDNLTKVLKPDDSTPAPHCE